MLVIPTLDEDGIPQCPVCFARVDREGEFCSPGCWEEFHILVFDMGDPIQMNNYLTLEEQPWYGTHHG